MASIRMLSLSCALALSLAAPAHAQDGGSSDRTRISGTIFANASDREGDFDAELKRFFVNIDHDFNEDWSLHFTSDVQWVRDSDPTDLWVLHMYLQRRLGQNASLQVGSAPQPWIPRMTKLNGFRYVDSPLLARAGVGSPAEWGVHLKGQQGAASYAVSVVTGSGYKKPTLGDTPDVEAAVDWQLADGWTVVLGGYRGRRAQDRGPGGVEHTATRLNAALAYVGEAGRWGVEGFEADNWNRINRVEPDESRGWSTWGSYRVAPEWTVFARHDRITPSRLLDPGAENEFSQAGVEWSPSRNLRLALAGKREEIEMAGVRRSGNEFGIWAQLNY
ncbi:TPA: hypothetical protein ACGY8F_003965 [Stenotrophomonas maltophilia]